MMHEIARNMAERMDRAHTEDPSARPCAAISPCAVTRERKSIHEQYGDSEPPLAPVERIRPPCRGSNVSLTTVSSSSHCEHRRFRSRTTKMVLRTGTGVHARRQVPGLRGLRT